jgi:hypothetical protein
MVMIELSTDATIKALKCRYGYAVWTNTRVIQVQANVIKPEARKQRA